MQKKSLKPRQGPEDKIQEDIIKFLRGREWLVKATHGNMYQSGFPDLYCTHKHHGIRWIEVKNPVSFSFTNAQKEWFPLLSANGTRIWVLGEATESEYKKLWLPENWREYMLRKLL